MRLPTRLFPIAVAVTWAVLVLPATADAGAHVDADRDRVYDDLEQTLAPMDGGEHVDVIVTLRSRATPSRVAALAREVGAFDLRRRFELVDAFAARMSKADVLALARLDGVAAVEADIPIHATNKGAQDGFGVTKARLDSGLDGNGAGTPETYEAGDLVAAVLDTGISASHLDLNGGKVLAFVDCLGGTCIPTSPVDPNGHGTHVAATLAGDGEARADRRDRGVAPGAGLVGVRVLDAAGGGFLSDFVAGLEWVVANRLTYGIEVINASVGATGCSSGTDFASAAVNNAVAAGLVVVVSAGNEGPERCTISTPAAAASAVTVGAMSDLQRSGFALAPFSSRGPTFDGRVKPDVLAPGVGIVSAGIASPTTYASYSGTSMAAPFVAGVALLMLDANPSLTPAQVKARLTSTAVDWGTVGADTETGAGRLDAYAALAAAGAPLSTGPSVPVHLLRSGSLTTPAALDFPFTILAGGLPFAATTVATTWATNTGAPDFDLTLVSSGGGVVASSATPFQSDWPGRRRHEALSVASLPAGAYTLRVTAAAGAGPFVLDLSGGFAPAPVAAIPPAVTGLAAVGSTLTATPGTWTAAGPLALAYQWRRCGAAGDCTDVPGATGASYAIPPWDLGSRLRVLVTATDSSGSATAPSEATAVVAPQPDTVAPVVRALASRGRKGRPIKLLYRVAENGPRTSERVVVYRRSRVLRTIRTPLSAREAGRTYYVFWRATRRAERLRFCVEAWDAAGLKSARSCASLVVR
jgi:serine protease AprX